MTGAHLRAWRGHAIVLALTLAGTVLVLAASAAGSSAPQPMTCDIQGTLTPAHEPDRTPRQTTFTVDGTWFCRGAITSAGSTGGEVVIVDQSPTEPSVVRATFFPVLVQAVVLVGCLEDVQGPKGDKCSWHTSDPEAPPGVQGSGSGTCVFEFGLGIFRCELSGHVHEINVT